MSQTPSLVDVAMVAYNHELFIAQALDSVFDQKTQFPLRILIGDDCSTDATRDIINDRGRRHPGVMKTVFPVEHLGLNHPDRLGIRVLRSCTAKYVALLDGDDYWTDPLKLQKQVDLLEAHPRASFSAHNARREVVGCPDQSADYFSVGMKQEWSTVDFMPRHMPSASVLYRRENLRHIPGWYHCLQVVGDWPLEILCSRFGPCEYIDEVMSVYRVHRLGVSRNRTGIGADVLAMCGFLNPTLQFAFADSLRDVAFRSRGEMIREYRRQGVAALCSGSLRAALTQWINALIIRVTVSGFHLGRARRFFRRGELRDAAGAAELELIQHGESEGAMRLLVAVTDAANRQPSPFAGATNEGTALATLATDPAYHR